MGLVVVTTVGLVVWLVMWALGVKALDCVHDHRSAGAPGRDDAHHRPVPAGQSRRLTAKVFDERSIARHLRASIGSRVLSGIAFLEEGNLRVRSLAASGCLVTALALGVAACGGGSDNKSSSCWWRRRRPHVADHLFEPAPAGRLATAVDRRGQRREARARGGRRQGRQVHDQVRQPRRRHRGGGQVGSGPDHAPTRARPPRTRPPSSTSASSTREHRRSRSRSSTRRTSCRSRPSNTYVGLTRSEGADKGEPDKYYPAGKRTYGRVVPADHIQAAAQVTYQKDQGCKKTYILNDKEVYGKGIAVQVAEHRQGPGPGRSPATTASTPRPPTSARWRRRSSPAARTACSSAASRRTRASRCSRTSTPPTRR